MIVVGIGNAGRNAINNMIENTIQGLKFIAIDFGTEPSSYNKPLTFLSLGEKKASDRSVGSGVRLSREAAERHRDRIADLMRGDDIALIVAGMGGMTGTGAAPVVGEVAKQSGALTIGIVTKPFTFEGASRNEVAEEGIYHIKENLDALVVISNDRLLSPQDLKTTEEELFKLSDDVLTQVVQAISEMFISPAVISLDFDETKAIMKDAGLIWMSVGHGSGKGRTIEAVQEALAGRWLDICTVGATSVLFDVSGGSDLTLYEVTKQPARYSKTLFRKPVSTSAFVRTRSCKAMLGLPSSPPGLS
jgi:cell division protein FtsZ